MEGLFFSAIRKKDNIAKLMVLSKKPNNSGIREGLTMAIQYDYLELIDILIPLVDDYRYAIMEAIRKKETKLVNLFFPKIQANYENYRMLHSYGKIDELTYWNTILILSLSSKYYELIDTLIPLILNEDYSRYVECECNFDSDSDSDSGYVISCKCDFNGQDLKKRNYKNILLEAFKYDNETCNNIIDTFLPLIDGYNKLLKDIIKYRDVNKIKKIIEYVVDDLNTIRLENIIGYIGQMHIGREWDKFNKDPKTIFQIYKYLLSLTNYSISTYDTMYSKISYSNEHMRVCLVPYLEKFDRNTKYEDKVLDRYYKEDLMLYLTIVDTLFPKDISSTILSYARIGNKYVKIECTRRSIENNDGMSDILYQLI